MLHQAFVWIFVITPGIQVKQLVQQKAEVKPEPGISSRPLFVVVISAESMGFAKVVFSGFFQIFADHFSDHVFEGDLRGPAELFLCFGRVAQQGFHFCGAKVSGINRNNGLAGCWVPGIGCRVLGAGEYGFFVYARTFPFNFHSQCPGRNIHKIPHRMLFARGNDKVFGLFLLEHEPLHLDIVFGMAPVAFGIQIPQIKAVLEPQGDAGQRPGDFAGDKGFPADRGFMVEQNAVARIDAVGFPKVDADPEGIQLGCGIGAAGVKRGGFGLFSGSSFGVRLTLLSLFGVGRGL